MDDSKKFGTRLIEFIKNNEDPLIRAALIIEIIFFICLVAYMLEDIACIFLGALFLVGVFWNAPVAEGIRAAVDHFKAQAEDQREFNAQLPYNVCEDFWRTLSAQLCKRLGLHYPLTAGEISYEGKEWKKPHYFKYSIPKLNAVPKKNYPKITRYINHIYMNSVRNENDCAGIYIEEVHDDPNEPDNLVFVIRAVLDAEDWKTLVQRFKQSKAASAPHKVLTPNDTDFGSVPGSIDSQKPPNRSVADSQPASKAWLKEELSKDGND